MTPKERARSLIDQNDIMILATSDAHGVPWASPVFYVPDDAYNLCWVSWKEARHSENIGHRKEVGIAIYFTDPAVDAVYVAAEASELKSEDDVEFGIGIMSRKPQPEHWQVRSAADVTGSGPWRIYRATPATIEVRLMSVAGDLSLATRQPADFRQDVS